jgi:hypothetical protein
MRQRKEWKPHFKFRLASVSTEERGHSLPTAVVLSSSQLGALVGEKIA